MALKCDSTTSSNSSASMSAWVGSHNGEKQEGRAEGSWNSYWLNYANFYKSTSVCTFYYLYTNFQNLAGSHFNIVGNSDAKDSLARLHSLRNALSASVAAGLLFPRSKHVTLYYFFNKRHYSVNHGANTLPQRLGLRGARFLETSTTPAATPASRRNCSTAADLASLLNSEFCTMLSS